MREVGRFRTAELELKWCARLARGLTKALWSLRDRSLFLCVRDSGEIWVGGESALTEDLRFLVASCAVACFYSIDGEWLIHQDHEIPETNLLLTFGGGACWERIGTALKIQKPLSAFAGHLSEPVKIDLPLVDSDTVTEAELQCVDFGDLRDFVSWTAPGRLSELKWQWNTECAIVAGPTLLPIPGARFHREQQFYLPLGKRLARPLSSGLVQNLFNVDERATILCIAPDKLQVLFDANWGELSKQTVKATADLQERKQL